ncbi:hypothetical protein GGX14DRAFT_387896 [Mycena pura]|uniref:Uncharacterized protein n=1 Tax=Mycena pura TaxID=153505 RepID=A0AAD6YMH8_9AGAR|nr:hypothetical protein GGX14DRAFT_387896 [Mycena pura]
MAKCERRRASSRRIDMHLLVVMHSTALALWVQTLQVPVLRTTPIVAGMVAYPTCLVGVTLPSADFAWAIDISGSILGRRYSQLSMRNRIICCSRTDLMHVLPAAHASRRAAACTWAWHGVLHTAAAADYDDVHSVGRPAWTLTPFGRQLHNGLGSMTARGRGSGSRAPGYLHLSHCQPAMRMSYSDLAPGKHAHMRHPYASVGDNAARTDISSDAELEVEI